LVGLFVNASAEEIQTVLDSVPLDVLQLHGDETPEQCQQIALHCKRRWYKAIQVRPDLDILTEIQRYQAVGASAVLLDAWHPDLKGGTGHCFDWNKFPKLDIPLILAGGLTPENVSDAIDTTAAFAVDVSGGVESAKGIKDQQLIEKFMQGVQRGSAKP
jgi:phosphoribosylanthranilate isomerase